MSDVPLLSIVTHVFYLASAQLNYTHVLLHVSAVYMLSYIFTRHCTFGTTLIEKLRIDGKQATWSSQDDAWQMQQYTTDMYYDR